MIRVLIGLVFITTLAGAADYGVGPAPYPAVPGHGYHALPACDEPGVLKRISDKFAQQDANITFTGLVIEHIGEVRERAARVGGPSLIDRRYCGATAWFSNGGTSEVVYLIEGPKLGTFSIGWSVESCLPDFDPYRVYDARCRAIGP